jgi:hypothetical protein
MGVINFIAEFDTSRVEPKVIKMNKDFDRLGASVRKYLEASRGPIDKMYSRLGDIQEKLEEIPQSLENITKKPKEYTAWLDIFEKWYLKIAGFVGATLILKAAFKDAGAAVGTFLSVFLLYTEYLESQDQIKPLERLGIAINDFLWPKAEYPTLPNALKNVYEWLMEITHLDEAVVGAFKALKEAFIDISSSFKEIGKGIYQSLKEGLLSAWGEIESFFNEKIAWIKSTFDLSEFFNEAGAKLDEFKKGLLSAWAKVEAWFTKKIDWIKNTFDFSEFFNEAGAKFDEFKKGLSDAWAGVEKFFSEKVEWIKKVFDIGEHIKGIGKQIIDKFKQGLSDGWEGAKDFFTKNVVNWLRGKLQLSNSPPFTIPYECGLGIMAAYSKGMKENLPLLESTLNEINTKVETGLQNPEVDMNQWFLDNIPYERDYSNLALLPPVASNKTGIDQSQTKKGGGEGAAKDSGFFGGLWSSFKSAVDDLKKQFGFGGGKGLLGNLFGGIGRDIKGLIKYVCYRNYTNFLYKQNVVFFWDAVKQSLTLFCKCQAGVNILFVEKFKKAAKPTTRFAYI